MIPMQRRRDEEETELKGSKRLLNGEGKEKRLQKALSSSASTVPAGNRVVAFTTASGKLLSVKEESLEQSQKVVERYLLEAHREVVSWAAGALEAEDVDMAEAAEAPTPLSPPPPGGWQPRPS